MLFPQGWAKKHKITCDPDKIALDRGNFVDTNKWITTDPGSVIAVTNKDITANIDHKVASANIALATYQFTGDCNIFLKFITNDLTDPSPDTGENLVGLRLSSAAKTYDLYIYLNSTIYGFRAEVNGTVIDDVASSYSADTGLHIERIGSSIYVSYRTVDTASWEWSGSTPLVIEQSETDPLKVEFLFSTSDANSLWNTTFHDVNILDRTIELVDFPLTLNKNSFQDDIFLKANSGGSDLRFTEDEKGFIDCPREIESFEDVENEFYITDGLTETYHYMYVTFRTVIALDPLVGNSGKQFRIGLYAGADTLNVFSFTNAIAINATTGEYVHINFSNLVADENNVIRSDFVSLPFSETDTLYIDYYVIQAHNMYTKDVNDLYTTGANGQCLNVYGKSDIPSWHDTDLSSFTQVNTPGNDTVLGMVALDWLPEPLPTVIHVKKPLLSATNNELWCWYNNPNALDPFNTNIIDADITKSVRGSYWKHEGNTLIFDSNGDAIPNSMLRLKPDLLIGDFDLEVSLDFYTTKRVNTHSFRFGVFSSESTPYIDLQIQIRTSSVVLKIFTEDGVWYTSTLFSDATYPTCKLRLKRVGSIISAFYDTGNGWDWDGNSAGYTLAASGGDMVTALADQNCTPQFNALISGSGRFRCEISNLKNNSIPIVLSDYDSPWDSNYIGVYHLTEDPVVTFASALNEPLDTINWKTTTPELVTHSYLGETFDSSDVSNAVSHVITQRYAETPYYTIIGDFSIELSYDVTGSVEPTLSSDTHQFFLNVYDANDLKSYSLNLDFGTDSKGITAKLGRPLLVTSHLTLPLSGKFKIVRKGSVLTCYYWDNNQWEFNGDTAGISCDGSSLTSNDAILQLKYTQSPGGHFICTITDLKITQHIFKDSTKNNHHAFGGVIGATSPSKQLGQIGYGQYFDGSNALYVPPSEDFHQRYEVTQENYFNPEFSISYRAFATGDKDWTSFSDSDGTQIRVSAINNILGTKYAGTMPSGLNYQGNYHYIAQKIDLQNSVTDYKLGIFYDNNIQDLTPVVGQDTPLTEMHDGTPLSIPMLFSSDITGANNHLIGTEDELRVSKIARSDAWLSTTNESIVPSNSFYSKTAILEAASFISTPVDSATFPSDNIYARTTHGVVYTVDSDAILKPPYDQVSYDTRTCYVVFTIPGVPNEVRCYTAVTPDVDIKNTGFFFSNQDIANTVTDNLDSMFFVRHNVDGVDGISFGGFSGNDANLCRISPDNFGYSIRISSVANVPGIIYDCQLCEGMVFQKAMIGRYGQNITVIGAEDSTWALDGIYFDNDSVSIIATIPTVNTALSLRMLNNQMVAMWTEEHTATNYALKYKVRPSCNPSFGLTPDWVNVNNWYADTTIFDGTTPQTSIYKSFHYRFVATSTLGCIVYRRADTPNTLRYKTGVWNNLNQEEGIITTDLNSADGAFTVGSIESPETKVSFYVYYINSSNDLRCTTLVNATIYPGVTKPNFWTAGCKLINTEDRLCAKNLSLRTHFITTSNYDDFYLTVMYQDSNNVIKVFRDFEGLFDYDTPTYEIAGNYRMPQIPSFIEIMSSIKIGNLVLVICQARNILKANIFDQNTNTWKYKYSKSIGGHVADGHNVKIFQTTSENKVWFAGGGRSGFRDYYIYESALQVTDPNFDLTWEGTTGGANWINKDPGIQAGRGYKSLQKDNHGNMYFFWQASDSISSSIHLKIYSPTLGQWSGDIAIVIGETTFVPDNFGYGRGRSETGLMDTGRVYPEIQEFSMIYGHRPVAQPAWRDVCPDLFYMLIKPQYTDFSQSGSDFINGINLIKSYKSDRVTEINLPHYLEEELNGPLIPNGDCIIRSSYVYKTMKGVCFERIDNTTYNVGDKVYSSGHWYYCITAGTTGIGVPSEFIDPEHMLEVSDGTVRWKEGGLWLFGGIASYAHWHGFAGDFHPFAYFKYIDNEDDVSTPNYRHAPTREAYVVYENNKWIIRQDNNGTSSQPGIGLEGLDNGNIFITHTKMFNAKDGGNVSAPSYTYSKDLLKTTSNILSMVDVDNFPQNIWAGDIEFGFGGNNTSMVSYNFYGSVYLTEISLKAIKSTIQFFKEFFKNTRGNL